ncbi:SUMF1/EgtB/PvdO family nonheme iron enzyme [Mesorhizobium sp. VK24D]|uniref:SUMF1/EgtB/PvdO family nonheme iron enzyme n=1 Tax=Mesorhizobium album TaxID=3072314 RepID=A0ABU4Y643_9HYPH|nr:SUMF1/EgtB/PvdO family nonheme iron enzyme [Mesorhizobium sp. VK24D]MDX8482412.1 SUMF1/EgtB/PvdO family nonheme iron enzyme [Mesorhizobium sp. VK24D]
MLLAVASLMWAGAAAADDDAIADNPLVEIPGGPFVFGNDMGNENERPQHIVEGQAFAMNQTEITNAQYRRFVTATGHRAAFYDRHPALGLPDHPVVGVSFADAEAFCAHYGLKLPSEQEYERAARGTQGARFPWGDAPVDAARANYGRDACCGGDDITAPARSLPQGASKEGLLNLVGNVWEWTRDFYAPYSGEAPPEIGGKYRVLRGGAWNSDPARLSTTYRLAYDPDFRFAANGGFRCVRSPD